MTSDKDPPQPVDPQAATQAAQAAGEAQKTTPTDGGMAEVVIDIVVEVAEGAASATTDAVVEGVSAILDGL